MGQQEIKPWVLVSNINEGTKPQDLERIAPQVADLVDEWHSAGRMMLSGAFDNDVSSMALFDATEDEAKEFFRKYERICSGVLGYYLYRWDAMPVLSVLSQSRR